MSDIKVKHSKTTLDGLGSRFVIFLRKIRFIEQQVKRIIKGVAPKKVWVWISKIWGFVRRLLFYQLTMPYRTVTAKRRALPDFLIIGTEKGGTTSFYYFLSQHPQIHVPSWEVSYFNKESNYEKGELWYRSNFPLISKINPGELVGDKTPGYLFSPDAPERIQKDLPNAKLICLLRNPTDRAISDYFMALRDKDEHLPIMDAMLADRGRYKNRGLYFEQLKRYERFLKNKRLLILSSEDFFAHPKKILKQVHRFLGTDEKFKPGDLFPKNVGDNKAPVSPEVYEYLNEYFKPHNQRLYNYLNRDFGW